MNIGVFISGSVKLATPCNFSWYRSQLSSAQALQISVALGRIWFSRSYCHRSLGGVPPTAPRSSPAVLCLLSASKHLLQSRIYQLLIATLRLSTGPNCPPRTETFTRTPFWALLFACLVEEGLFYPRVAPHPAFLLPVTVLPTVSSSHFS